MQQEGSLGDIVTPLFQETWLEVGLLAWQQSALYQEGVLH